MIFIAPRGFYFDFVFFGGKHKRSESQRKLIERPMNNIYLILNSLCVNFCVFFGIQIFLFLPPIIFFPLREEEIIHLFNSFF